MAFFGPLTYNFTVAARLWIDRSRVQISVEATHFFSKFYFLSEINIELTISVAISLIANLLQLKHWKTLVALYKNKLVYNLTTFTFLTFWDPNKFSAFCALIYCKVNYMLVTETLTRALNRLLTAYCCQTVVRLFSKS
jgi:hypothetical protein